MWQQHRHAVRLDLKRRNLAVCVDSVDLDEDMRVLPLELRHYRIESDGRGQIEFLHQLASADPAGCVIGTEPGLSSPNTGHCRGGLLTNN